jgi:hypothetical protein
LHFTHQGQKQAVPPTDHIIFALAPLLPCYNLHL